MKLLSTLGCFQNVISVLTKNLRQEITDYNEERKSYGDIFILTGQI